VGVQEKQPLESDASVRLLVKPGAGSGRKNTAVETWARVSVQRAQKAGASLNHRGFDTARHKTVTQPPRSVSSCCIQAVGEKTLAPFTRMRENEAAIRPCQICRFLSKSRASEKNKVKSQQKKENA